MGRTQALTPDEIRALPAAVDIPTAGRAFGIGRDAAYRLARSGRFPCDVLSLGPSYKVARSSILKALGIEDSTPEVPRPEDRAA